MWIRFVGAHFTKLFCILHLFAPIHSDVRVGDNFECVSPFDALVVWGIGPIFYALSQWTNCFGICFIQNCLILGMFPQLSVFKVLSCFFIKYRNFPVEYKLAQVTAHWCSHRGDKVSHIWARALCDRFIGHRVRLGVMRMCASFNGLMVVILMWLTMWGWCMQPWLWCLHPWIWGLRPWIRHRCCWNAQPLILHIHCWVVHPWRCWCQKLARFAPFSALFKLWSATVDFLIYGLRRPCANKWFHWT